jgi:hypothetical protein
MIRFLSAFGVTLLALVSFGLYNGVYRVKAQEHELEALKSDLTREAEAIRVLKAEWSYLNQPDRLQALAQRHLALAPTGASQITVLASLPLRSSAPSLNEPSPVVEAEDLPERVVPQRAVPNTPLPRAKPLIDQKAKRP